MSNNKYINISIPSIIIGAFLTLAIVTLTSCTTSITQGPDGSWSYSSELVPPPGMTEDIIVKTLDGEEK